jgi:DNA-binding NtrC family response regulator
MVITEALLPKSHGFTLSKYISDNYSGLKIIIISEKLKDVDYRKEALEHGACEFFEKPLNPIEFKDKVAKHLNITEQEQKKYHNETTKINITPLLNKNKSGEKEIDSKEEDIVEKLKKELNPYEIKLD